jgi:hypothetical protein
MNTKELATLIHQTTRARLYESRYFHNPMHYAQDQLIGRTHYVDDSTLRYFHARVIGAHDDADGLLFWIVESSARDYENTARGFRPVVFDIFGEVVYRVSLAEMVKTSDKARALYRDWLESFDIVDHYREALEHRAQSLENEAQQYREALQALEPATA